MPKFLVKIRVEKGLYGPWQQIEVTAHTPRTSIENAVRKLYGRNAYPEAPTDLHDFDSQHRHCFIMARPPVDPDRFRSAHFRDRPPEKVSGMVHITTQRIIKKTYRL